MLLTSIMYLRKQSACIQEQANAARPRSAAGSEAGSLRFEGDADEGDALGKAIRAQHPIESLSDEERQLVEAQQAALLRRLSAQGIKLTDCIARKEPAIGAGLAQGP